MSFNDFVSTELPLRPFAPTDGAPGQVLARSGNADRPRETVWVDLPSGPGAANISADQDNRLTRGSDNGLFVNNDLTPDPLAYYILSKG